MQNRNSIKAYLGALVVIVIIFGVGYYAGYAHRPWVDRVASVTNKDPQTSASADFSPFWKVWDIINEKSPNASAITDQDRVWGAVEGLMGSLNDPYSEFFPPKEAKNFQDQISGQFSGVGMEVGIKNKTLTVIAPIKGSPAEAAGIKAGDMIIKIGDVTTSDLPLDTAVEMMRGDKGTSITLTIYHEGNSEPRKVTMVRDIIAIPTIDQKVLAGGVHVISLYSFDANASDLFRTEIQKFKASGDTKLIVDLRGNPGGYLDAAVDIASWFLSAGKTIVKEDYGTKQAADVYTSKGYNLFDSNLKMAILVDGGSASASEILSGALSEQGVAKLIGTQTFGKGSVQEVVPVTDDTFLKITIAKWLTPNGISISDKGLTPDIEVHMPTDVTSKADPQLDRAVQYVKTGK